MAHHAKRWLYIVHRWVGIVTCLFFAMWFLSGLVMIYVPFPGLSRAERVAGLAPIDWPSVRIQPGAALAAAGLPDPPRTLTLEMQGDAPVWRIRPRHGEEAVVSAAGGDLLGSATDTQARRTAALFGRAPVAAMSRVVRDQWTVAGSFDRHRPLWKAELAGDGGRVLYVSSRTGAVVLDTDARERFWNWIGSVPHWLYPTIVRQDNALWRQVVMWVSFPCIVGAVTGMWVGILRTRVGKRRFKGGRMTPYRGWMLWHHWAGLVGGTALLLWIFSGWLSVDPFRLFASGGIGEEARLAYEAPRSPPSLDLARLAHVGSGARQVAVRWFDGRPFLMVERPGRSAAVDARNLAPVAVPGSAIVAAARRLVPGTPISSVTRLTEPDAYWYELGERPTLPVLRIAYADAARTWVHIDPATGALLGDLDARRRTYRWMFDLFHKWDLNVLTLHRPAWDGLLWALSLLGLATSITGIWIGWRRLRRR